MLALTVSCAYAGGYGYGSSGLGLGLGLRSGLGLRTTGLLNGGYAARSFGPIPAAIQSTRTYEVVPVALNYEAAVPQTIEVGPNVQPINMIFRTQSSPLNLQQVHTPAAPQYESTRSEDEASVLTHESYRPVIQNYRETIQPFRNIEQRVQPVIENVHTVVAKGEELRVAPAYAAPVAPVALLSGKSY